MYKKRKLYLFGPLGPFNCVHLPLRSGAPKLGLTNLIHQSHSPIRQVDLQTANLGICQSAGPSLRFLLHPSYPQADSGPHLAATASLLVQAVGVPEGLGGEPYSPIYPKNPEC